MALIDGYDTVMFDLDGVLFRGRSPIPGAPETVEAVRARGLKVVFLTNNASRTIAQVVSQLASVGIGSSAPEIETSARAAGAVLGERGVTRVLVIGQDGILESLADAGVDVVGIDDEPEVVLVGLDRNITYEKLRDASLAVQRGARLMATNADSTFPAEDGLWPGAGALLAAVVATTGAVPEVIGKPAATIFRKALERAGGRTPIVVGDRLDTDIAGAASLGWDSLLVLTGVDGVEDVDRGVGSCAPTFVAPDVTGLLADTPRWQGSAGLPQG